MKSLYAFALIGGLLLVSGFTECYKPVTSSGLPKNVRVVAVPAFVFEAKGMRYRVESRFTEAVSREIIRRGNGLKVQGTRTGADAVVEGTIRDFNFSGVLLDKNGALALDSDDEIVAGTIITRGGEIVHAGTRSRMGME
jgi:hypothetical protein